MMCNVEDGICVQIFLAFEEALVGGALDRVVRSLTLFNFLIQIQYIQF